VIIAESDLIMSPRSDMTLEIGGMLACTGWQITSLVHKKVDCVGCLTKKIHSSGWLFPYMTDRCQSRNGRILPSGQCYVLSRDVTSPSQS
jgi:hypothetical protein